VKRILVSVFFITLIAALAVAQTKGRRAAGNRTRPAAAAGVEQTLIDVERQFSEAFKNRDQQALGLLLADNFIFTDEEGQVFDKAKYLQSIASVQVESYKLDDLAARVSGTTGVVTGLWTGKMTVAGKDASSAVRFTDTFVKRLNRWVVLASHESRIPQKGMDMSNAVTTPSGLKYIDEVVGTGASPEHGQMVTVHYTGTLENGTKFDSSYDHGQPFTFQIGVSPVIRGWAEGLMTMKVGGKRRLIIPPQLGYGARGAGNVIPPNATLIFEVELLKIQ